MGSFFIHGALAWATLALVSIPIVIHLINRRRFRRIDWAAMEFLLDALKKNRRRVRVEQLILLLLRVALMALIGFLVARPVLSERGLEWLAGAFRSEEKIFVLDDSFSMARREADRSAFQRAADALGVQVRRLAERGGGDRLTVIRGSRHRAPVVRGVFADAERAASLAQSIARLIPTDSRLPLAEAFDSVVEATAREDAGGARPRAISLLTDLQAAHWTDGRGGADGALQRALRRLGDSEERPTRITILDTGAADGANVAITRVAFEGGRPVAEIPAEVRVEVRNFSPAAARGLGLRLRYAPAGTLSEGAAAVTALGPPIEEIAPGAAVAASIPCTFRLPGHYGITVELTGARDALPGDDTFPLAVEVVAATEVLLASGEPSSEPFEGETDFLAAALSPQGEVASGIKPATVLEESLPRDDLDRHAAVFLANVHGVPPEALPALGRYVRGGGTLVIFPGDQVDAALYNRQMGRVAPPAAPPPSPTTDQRPEQGLLPAWIGELRTEEEPVGLAPSFDHPFFRPLRDARDLIGMSRFEKRFALDPLPGAQVIATFTDADSSAAIVEHAVDRGRVVLFATAADLEWSDWPKNPSYLMVLQEIAALAARSRMEAPEHLAGAAVEIPVDIAQYAREARLRPPGYPSQPERTLVASPPAGAEGGPAAPFRFVIDDTDRAGLYALGLKTQSGAEEWRMIAVRRDPVESDPARVTATKLKELYPDVELTVVKDAAGFSDVGRGRFEVADFLLWAFLAFIFVEGFLARWFAHHGSSSATQTQSVRSEGGRP